MSRRAVVAFLLVAAPALARQDPARPAVGPAPIHPSDLNPANSQQRVDEIRRSGNPGDYGQMNSLDSLRRQSEGMRGSGAAPIPSERRDVPPRAAPHAPGDWPGSRPGYLPRQ